MLLKEPRTMKTWPQEQHYSRNHEYYYISFFSEFGRYRNKGKAGNLSLLSLW